MTLDDLLAAPVISGRAEHLRRAYQVAPRGGLVAEFGVWRGSSLRCLCDTQPERTVFGFDSFRGLPEQWVLGEGDSRPAGHFRLDQIPDVPSNAVLVVGPYESTVPRFFGEIATEMGIDFAHVDCDLYSSTATVLAGIGPRLRVGSILVFDEIASFDGSYPEWQQGEWKALREWVQHTGRVVEPISRTETQQAAFQVTR